MASSILLWPGQVRAGVALQPLLREAWADMRTARQTEIDERSRAGIPLDDLSPLPEWADLAELDGVTADLVVLSEQQRAHLAAEVADAVDDVRAMLDGEKPRHVDLARVQARLAETQGAFVVASMRAAYVDGEPVSPAELVAATARSGVLWAVHRACAEFQALPPKKLARCGQRAAST